MSRTERSWLVVALCALVVVAEGYDLIVYGALLPKLLSEPGWGLTAAGAGTIGSQVYVGMLVGALAGGPVADRFGRRRLVIASVGWFTLWTFACALAVQPWQLGAFRLLAGLGMGAVIPAAVALAKEHAAPARTGLVVTILMAGIPIGGTAASLLGLAVLPTHGWRPMFVLGGVISAGILVAAVALLPESRALRTPEAAPVSVVGRFGELFRHHRAVVTVLFALAAFANLLTWYGLNTWLTTLMRRLDYPLSSALQFSLTLNSGAVAGSFVMVALAARAGYRQVALLCTILTAGGMLALTTGPQGAALLLAVIALVGAGAHSALTLLLASVADTYPTAARASAIGWTNGTGRLGAVVAPALGGAILAAGLGPRAVFLTFSVTALCATAVVAALILRGRQAPSPVLAPAEVVE